MDVQADAAHANVLQSLPAVRAEYVALRHDLAPRRSGVVQDVGDPTLRRPARPTGCCFLQDARGDDSQAECRPVHGRAEHPSRARGRDVQQLHENKPRSAKDLLQAGFRFQWTSKPTPRMQTSFSLFRRFVRSTLHCATISHLVVQDVGDPTLRRPARPTGCCFLQDARGDDSQAECRPVHGRAEHPSRARGRDVQQLYENRPRSAGTRRLGSTHVWMHDRHEENTHARPELHLQAGQATMS